MATKWKNSLLFVVLAFLLTFGLSGILTFFASGNQYFHRDYFHTPPFQSQLEQFSGYLNMFELNEVTMEEAKKSVTVTQEEIDEHRYRYGSLNEQIANIKDQYEFRIQEAMETDNKEAANAYIEDRDRKIEDITNNFKSDDHVRQKIIQEKEQKIEEYFKERDNYRAEFSRLEEAFKYYYKDTVTGKVYTNLNIPENDSAKDYMNKENMLFVTSYSIPRDYFIHFGDSGFNNLAESILPQTSGTFEGQIAVAKSTPLSSSIMVDYENFKKGQLILIIYILSSVIALMICFFLRKKGKTSSGEMGRWQYYYNKLPIDTRAIFFTISGIGAILFLFLVNDQFYYINDNPFLFAGEVLFCLVISSFFMALTLIQGKFLSEVFKDWSFVKKEWEKGLVNQAWKSLIRLFQKAKSILGEALLNRSTGTQLFVLLGLVYGLGIGAIMLVIHPVFLLLYLLLLAVVGIPIIMTLIKKVGYFNRIVLKTNELVTGNHGEDLPVTGKSVLATLADNINLLKRGVKHSQSEQAKSERLKSELITNVSHDLRTPLTSIITYTELLKTNDLSGEDRAAYLEIIDRKSKRLKVLIEDLFEVSKMASGSVNLVKERVDLTQLLQQALAEHDNTISESSLQFRVANTGKPVYALVDGHKLWRVFDNLIGNVLKYSQENTRVYISIKTIDEEAIITFKNVSKYELSDNTDELFERFKRGDMSRHTDGSGLGLAIAKSIVDLHEGSLDIEADGDLFKVIISLKLAD